MRIPLRFNSAARQFQKAFFVHHLSFVFLSMEDAAPVLGAAFSGSLGTLLRVRSHLWDVMCVLQTCCGDCDFRACRGARPCPRLFSCFFIGHPASVCACLELPLKGPACLPRHPGPAPPPRAAQGPNTAYSCPGGCWPSSSAFVSRNSRTVGGTCFSHSRVIAYSVAFSMVVSFLCRKQVRASTWFSGIEVVICFYAYRFNSAGYKI